MVRLTILRKVTNHDAATPATPAYLPPSHLTYKLPPITVLPVATTTEGGASLRRWEKGSSPKKTHRPPHISPGPTRRRRRRHKLLSSPPPPTPTIRYRKRTSIAWLLLRHRFLTAYSAHPNNTDADSLSNISSLRQPQTLPQQTSHDDPISNYISTISTCINCELLDFHFADEQLCDKISSLDLDTVDESTYHTPNPIEQLFISLSNKLDNKKHGI
jgi:hypothetical protein